MNAGLVERLTEIEAQAALLGRGERSEYLKRSAQDLGVSLATLYRKLESVSVKPSRKRRSDAGKTELKLEEAKLISAVLVETMRRNGKRLMSVKQAVEMLRANAVWQNICYPCSPSILVTLSCLPVVQHYSLCDRNQQRLKY